jgi:hypothetical protein
MGQRPLPRVLLRHSDFGRGDADTWSRLSDDIAYMINDTGASTVLSNADFQPLLERLSKIAIADHVALVDDLPLTSVYKVDKKKL